MNKKKLILTIMGIVFTLLLTICIVSIAASYSIGFEKTMGVNVNDDNIIDLMYDMDYFCGFNGVDLGSYNSPAKYKNNATIRINGNKSTISVLGVSNELTYTETDTKASMILALVYNNIKDKTDRVRYGLYNSNKMMSFSFDYGQAAIWYAFGDWNSNVGANVNNNKWAAVRGALGTSITTALDTSWNGYAELVNEQREIFELGKTVYQNATNNVNQLADVANTEYGIKETYYNNSSADKKVSVQAQSGEYTILGPFKYNFTSTLKNGKPTLTFDSSTTSQDYEIGTYTNGNFNTTNGIVSGTSFYIKVRTSLISNVTKFKFGFQVEGISLRNTTTTINIFLDQKTDRAYQPIIYFEQTEGYYSPFSDTYELSKSEISIEKLDASGNKINIDGITFELKDNGTTIAHFITDSNGNVIVVDGNGQATGKTSITVLTQQNHEYTLVETNNPEFGYEKINLTTESVTITGATKVKVENNSITLKLNSNSAGKVIIKINNKQELGNLKLDKFDHDTGTPLSAVKFVVERTYDSSEYLEYLQLYDENGTLVEEVTGQVTINNNNIAVLKNNGKEYHVEYLSIEKDAQEAKIRNCIIQATKFITNNNGNIIISNLGTYNRESGEKYKYTLIETENSNYGYSESTTKQETAGIETAIRTETVELKSLDTVTVKLANKQKYIKISGYVWLDAAMGKSNTYDCVYTNTENGDRLLTDIYNVVNGEVQLNPNAAIPVEIKLINDKGEEVKSQPDEFSNGKYTFTDVLVENLDNYKVQFSYDGFHYTTTAVNLDKDNGSKVKEDASQRTNLNNKFGQVVENGVLISADNGKKEKVTYDVVEGDKYQTSTVKGFGFETTLEATTDNAGIELNKIKENVTTPIKEIENINMGLILREQPKVAIGSDIHSVSVEVNGSNYNYYYNGRQYHYDNENDDIVGVKFEQEKALSRYTRTVYSSDVEAVSNGNATMNVSIIYKIKLINQSTTLTSVVNEITNYFDGRYTIVAIGSNIEGVVIDNPDGYQYGEAIDLETENSEYKLSRITLGESGLSVAAGQSKDIYIKFSVNQEAIIGLIDGKSTYHNATEITKYTTCYGEHTGYQLNNDTSEYDKIVTEEAKVGKIYSGIDRASQPGNITLSLIKDERDPEGTLILDTSKFEDDTTSAPAFILDASEARKISGIVWKDETEYSSEAGRVGDGIYDIDEKVLGNVSVELCNVNENGTIGDIAKYSNGLEAKTITGEDGIYTFGYYDENTRKHVGILPGRYVIKFTYNNESYIVGNGYINVNDYKSTIIKSDVLKEAFINGNEMWYATQDETRYSDAKDDISLRPEYNLSIDPNINVTNSTYNNKLSITSMNAYTPVMDIGVEFVATTEILNAHTATLEKTLTGVDFGIAERANVDITIEKKITGLEIIAQNGTAIIPKGNPADVNSRMQYVKNLESEGTKEQIVSAEIETKLLQGAQLNLEYTITVVNNSEVDFIDEDYYYYGENGITKTHPTAQKVIDYMDDTMEIDLERSIDWTIVGADELYSDDGNDLNDLVSKEVYEVLKTGEYEIAITDAFKDIECGNTGEIKLYTTRYLAVSDSIREENKVEIIEIEGKRSIKDSIPGDYVPSESTTQDGEDEADLVITPPTGSAINYILYAISGIAMLSILVIGIVIIKKKIVK